MEDGVNGDPLALATEKQGKKKGQGHAQNQSHLMEGNNAQGLIKRKTPAKVMSKSLFSTSV